MSLDWKFVLINNPTETKTTGFRTQVRSHVTRLQHERSRQKGVHPPQEHLREDKKRHTITDEEDDKKHENSTEPAGLVRLKAESGIFQVPWSGSFPKARWLFELLLCMIQRMLLGKLSAISSFILPPSW
nr:hypothetical protein CFP56_46762 [Quercus suber]